MRRFNPNLFARAGQQVGNFLSVLLFVVMTLGTVAIAQTVDTAPLPAGTTTDATTVLGWILRALLGGAFIAGAWACWKLSQFLGAKATQTGADGARSAGWGLVNMVWLKVQTAGAKILSKEKPLMEKILADGQVTHDEVMQLTNAILVDVREVAAAELPMLKNFLGGEGVLNTMLHGWAATVATKLLSGGAGNAPTTSAPAIVAAAPVAAPSSPV